MRDDEIRAKLDELMAALSQMGAESELVTLRNQVGHIHALVYPTDGTAGVVARLDALRARVEQLELGRERAAITRREVIVASIGGVAGVISALFQVFSRWF